VHFEASGSGLVVQSWKDSHDSMNHANGSPAEQPLAVAEVQGYAYAAFLGGARLLEKLGQTDRCEDLRRRAAALARSFHARYWLDDLGTYAMALDKHGEPLRVLSSDPGAPSLVRHRAGGGCAAPGADDALARFMERLGGTSPPPPPAATPRGQGAQPPAPLTHHPAAPPPPPSGTPALPPWWPA
jgi:hypothetical protein